jgi:hypothetical protein
MKNSNHVNSIGINSMDYSTNILDAILISTQNLMNI